MKEIIANLLCAVGSVAFIVGVLFAFTDASFILYFLLGGGGLLMYLIGNSMMDDDLITDMIGVEKEVKNDTQNVILSETHCSSCGAPLKDDTCSYCGSKSVVYKKIK